MIKVVAENAWDGSLWNDDTPRTTLIKRASNGSFDQYDFIKKAEHSSKELLDKVASLDVKPGEELIHLIALGTTEAYGPNRNGDGFKKKACVEYHPWFVKEARFYRNHKNTDKAKSYGIVKASAFNDTMNRVELIVALNGTEKAASANGGLVADKEMEKLASGDNLSVSMACAHDPLYPVLVKNKGYIPIVSVTTDDYVLTEKSGWKKVTQLNRRIYTGDIYKLYYDKIPAPFEITADHLMLVVRNQSKEWVRADNLKVGDQLVYTESLYKFDADNVDIKDTADTLSRALSIRDKLAAKYNCLPTITKHEDGTYTFSIDNDNKNCTITRIEKYAVVDDQTYNFEVEDDPSYSAAGLVSHNCKVPFDVCSYCGNKATTRDDYCDADTCKAGGLKHNICKIASVDGKLHHLHADNTEPHFFDISNVFVPADRIAYSSGWLNKHASWDVMSGAELAEAYNIASPVITKQASHNPLPAGFGNVVSILKDAVQGFHDNNGWTKKASYLGVISNKPLSRTSIPRMYKLGSLARALVNEQTCLTPTQFIQLITDYPFEKCAEMGEIIAPLSNESLVKMSAWDLAENPYMPDTYAPEALTSWVRAQQLPTLDPRSIVKQAAFNSIEEAMPRKLSGEAIYSLVDDPSISALADQFALYKTAFVVSLPSNKQELAANILVGRDYMSF